jgi:hypothetical protein
VTPAARAVYRSIMAPMIRRGEVLGIMWYRDGHAPMLEYRLADNCLPARLINGQ